MRRRNHARSLIKRLPLEHVTWSVIFAFYRLAVCLNIRERNHWQIPCLPVPHTPVTRFPAFYNSYVFLRVSHVFQRFKPVISVPTLYNYYKVSRVSIILKVFLRLIFAVCFYASYIDHNFFFPQMTGLNNFSSAFHIEWCSMFFLRFTQVPVFSSFTSVYTFSRVLYNSHFPAPHTGSTLSYQYGSCNTLFWICCSAPLRFYYYSFICRVRNSSNP